jgi:hypothetical protein
LEPLPPTLKVHWLQFGQLCRRKALGGLCDVPVEPRPGIVRGGGPFSRSNVFDITVASIKYRQALGATTLPQMTKPLVGSVDSRIEAHVRRQFLEVPQRMMYLPHF